MRGAIELISPGNKDRLGSRRAFAAKCAGYLSHGINVILVDIVTSQAGNMHEELFDMLEVKCPGSDWQSPSALYAVAYRAVTELKAPRIEVWQEDLALGKALPVMPLWSSLELCVPVRLGDSYLATCRSLRIGA